MKLKTNLVNYFVNKDSRILIYSHVKHYGQHVTADLALGSAAPFKEIGMSFLLQQIQKVTVESSIPLSLFLFHRRSPIPCVLNLSLCLPHCHYFSVPLFLCLSVSFSLFLSSPYHSSSFSFSLFLPFFLFRYCNRLEHKILFESFNNISRSTSNHFHNFSHRNAID